MAAALTWLCLLAAVAAGRGESASGNAASGEAASGHAASGEAASGEAASGEAASGNAAGGEPARPSPGRDVCSPGGVKQVGLCFVSWTSEKANFGELPPEYTRVEHLSNEFRISWTTYRATATEAG